MGDETVDRETAWRDAQRVVVGIKTAKDTIHNIRASLREDMPEVMKELEEAERDLPLLQEESKEVLRRLGSGQHSVAGHVVLVKAAPSKVVPDIEGLVERAKDRDEVKELLEAGVLKYDVVTHQIARLPSKLRAIYEGYLVEKVGTASVVLPPDLK